MTLEAWHFLADTGLLRDGRPCPPDGVALEHDGKLIMCEAGLHASVRAIDALQYAPGSIACLVRCEGEVIHEKDKLVCSRRTVIGRVDATPILRAFARWCALQVIDEWDAPQVMREYLETGDESKRSAALAAARDAAWCAALDAARAAAWAAALDDALDAARAAALDAAWCAARGAQNTELEHLLRDALKAQAVAK